MQLCTSLVISMLLSSNLKSIVEKRWSRNGRRSPEAFKSYLTKSRVFHFLTWRKCISVSILCFYAGLTTWIQLFRKNSLKRQQNGICSLLGSLLQNFPLKQTSVYRRKEGNNIFPGLNFWKKLRLCVTTWKLSFHKSTSAFSTTLVLCLHFSFFSTSLPRH